LRILEATRDFWFNILHVHGQNIMFDPVADYPAQAINWHDQETPPSLKEATARFPGALVGGLRQEETMAYGTPDQVRAEVGAAIQQTGGRRLIIGTGCVIPIIAPMGNLWAAREAVESA
jgi:uroporphyrinogen decarboxylase